MIERRVCQLVRERLLKYPAVALLGPRQSGKTTLAQSLKGEYFDLENDADQVALDLHWPEHIASGKLLILDEAQSWPALFARLRGEIDRQSRHNGRFLLLGSVSPALMHHVSESLAGRLALVELTPFLAEELPGKSLNDLWLHGGFPRGGILEPGRYPNWQENYLSLLVQRDLPDWGLPAKPQVTDRLVRMAAAVHGQAWNASQIGQSLGLNYQTVNGYMDYLQGAFLVRRLQPFHAKMKKRLVKRPKFYWRDTGLLHAILHVKDYRSLLAQPWVGASWEGFVIEQVLGAASSRGRSFEPYFLATSDQREIDLVLDFGGDLWAVETKLTSSPSLGDIERLNNTADLIGAKRRVLVSRTAKPTEARATASTNLSGLLRMLAEQL